MKQWFKHAFAVDQGELEPTQRQQEVVDTLAKFIARRHLTTPALAFLEMSRPLNYMASQTMNFFMPLVKIITDAQGIQAFTDLLEHRGSIDYLCRRIEAAEAEYEGTSRKNIEQQTKRGENEHDLAPSSEHDPPR